MLLRPASALFLLYHSSEASPPPAAASLVLLPWALFLTFTKRRAGFRSSEAAIGGHAITGRVFETFEELKNGLALVPTAPYQSLARHKFANSCEAAINEQINVEYNVCYVYHTMFAHFDQNNVAPKGLAKFFKGASEEERKHAEKFMKYQLEQA